jgi:putative sigma-54 modulation protein
MEFKITGRHLEITPAIREYAQKKTERVHRYFNRIQEIQVVVDKQDRSFEVELIVDVEHHDSFIARHKDVDLYAAIDQTLDKMERQLTDHKEKLRNRKHIAQ